MSIHEKFATLLNRLAVTPNIARARREDAVRAANVAVKREIDHGVMRAITRLEKRVAEVEKTVAS